MKKNKIPVIWGEATIDAPGKVTVKASKSPAPKDALPPGAYGGKAQLLANRRAAARAAGSRADKKLVWTYFEAMAPEGMPKSLLVVGSGASASSSLILPHARREVTVVEVLPQILPVEDAEIAAFRPQGVREAGIKIFTGAKVTKLDKKADSVTATIEDGKGGTQTLSVERVIAAVGVTGNIENLGLEKLGVKTDRGTIVVDALNKTNVPGIYAIGDVAGRRCWRTRPSTKASSASRRSRACIRIRWTRRPDPGCTIASRRSPRSG